MVNLLGLEGAAPLDERLTALRQLPDAHLHWYGKTPETPGRKLGHVTVLLPGPDADARAEQSSQALRQVRAIWPNPS